MRELIYKIKEKWQMIVATTFILTAVVFSISAFIPPKYSSEISLIIIQKQASYKVDAFSAAKSAEYLSDIFARVAYTESFLVDVLEAPYEVDKEKFSDLSEKRKKQWENKLDVKKLNNTGIIKVIVYDESREQAEKIARSVDWAYSVRGEKYHGGGDRVKISLIDGPITSENPAKPNLLLNTLLALVIGLAGSISLAYFIEDFDLKIFEKRKGKSFRDGGGSDQQGEDFSREEDKKRDEIIQKIMDLKKRFQQKKQMSDLEKNYDEKTLLDKKDLIQESDEASQKSDEKKMKQAEEGFRIIGEQEKEQAEEFKTAPSLEKKSAAPENLPFMEEEKEEEGKKEDNGFVDIAELEKDSIDKGKKSEDNKEPSENEVKERLNKLLKGDL